MSASLIVEPAAVKFSAVVSILFKDLSSLFCVEPSRPLIVFKLVIVSSICLFAFTAPSWVAIEREFNFKLNAVSDVMLTALFILILLSALESNPN